MSYHRNLTVLVPKLHDQWIEGNYGPQWRVQNTGWHWYNSPQNFIDETFIPQADVMKGKSSNHSDRLYISFRTA
jgi:hypothetical protein